MKVSNEEIGTGVAMNSDNRTIAFFQRTKGRSVNRSLDGNRSIRYRPRDKIRFNNRRSEDRPFNIKLYRLKFFGSINSNNKNLKVCSLGC